MKNTQAPPVMQRDAARSGPTAWTPSGHRIEVTRNGANILLALQTQVLNDQQARRTTWVLSNLGIPAGTPIPVAERLVSHWLSFYEDEEIVRLGVAALRGRFEEAPLGDDSPGAPLAPPKQLQ